MLNVLSDESHLNSNQNETYRKRKRVSGGGVPPTAEQRHEISAIDRM